MNYVAFVVTEGETPKEAVEIMNREFPAYFEEMDRRGVRLLGRELAFPETAATVRVRSGETLVADGPFTETKEFVGGFDLLDCADLDEAIEVEGKSPVARFHPCEIRPFEGKLRLGPGAAVFARGDDSAGPPFLLAAWLGETPTAPADDRTVAEACDAWRQELEARDVFVLGGALGGPETATTLRPRSEGMQVSDGPFLDIKEVLGSVDVVRCADRQQAIELAAAHPLARDHVIEVRPFYNE